MDKNLLGMYDLKIERLKKALERNNMTCNVFNTEEELHDYFKTIWQWVVLCHLMKCMY